MNEVDILRDLVAIPSVSSLSNVPVINYALKFLGGWEVDRYSYTDSSGVAKLPLVWAVKGFDLLMSSDGPPSP